MCIQTLAKLRNLILSEDGFEIKPKYCSFNRFLFFNTSIEFTRCISSEYVLLFRCLASTQPERPRLDNLRISPA